MRNGYFIDDEYLINKKWSISLTDTHLPDTSDYILAENVRVVQNKKNCTLTFIAKKKKLIYVYESLKALERAAFDSISYRAVLRKESRILIELPVFNKDRWFSLYRLIKVSFQQDEDVYLIVDYS